jgi:tetrapyrrole methylase family protein/MazG family protein
MPLVSRKSGIESLLEVMAALRSETGCPWDREQTHSSLKPFLIEECAELLDAIDDLDDEGIKEELGDILMHITFHAKIAEDEKRFDFDDIARTVAEKMVRRHPHVFGDENADNPDDVLVIWKEAKRKEKGDDAPKSVLDRIPRHLPALLRAREMQLKAAEVGFDWDSIEPVLDKIDEESRELREALASGDTRRVEEEVGDLLFAVVNFTRFSGGPTGEELLAKANDKFRKRFQYIERKLAERGTNPKDTAIDEMEALWEEAKKKL